MRTLLAFGAAIALALPRVGIAAESSVPAASTVGARAPVARLISRPGGARVSHGGVVRAAGPVTVVRGGERVLASAQSMLIYRDGCTVFIPARSAMVVRAVSSCAGQAALQKAVYVYPAGGGWLPNIGYIKPKPPEKPPERPGPHPIWGPPLCPGADQLVPSAPPPDAGAGDADFFGVDPGDARNWHHHVMNQGHKTSCAAVTPDWFFFGVWLSPLIWGWSAIDYHDRPVSP